MEGIEGVKGKERVTEEAWAAFEAEMKEPGNGGRVHSRSRRMEGISRIGDRKVREVVEKRAREKAGAIKADLWMAEERRYHAEECEICGNVDRGAIEKEFRDWKDLKEICKDWDLERRGAKRHFMLLGMYREREENRAGPYREIVRKGMRKLAKGEMKIEARDVIQANNSLVQMEGGFKTNIELSGKIEAVAAEYANLSIEQLDAVMDEMVQRLANPGKKSLGAGSQVITVKATEVKENTDGEHDNGRGDGLSDSAEVGSAGSRVEVGGHGYPDGDQSGEGHGVRRAVPEESGSVVDPWDI